MRYTVIKIRPYEDDLYYRYDTVSIDKDDLEDEDGYFSWNRREGYQWFDDHSDIGQGEMDYIILFFESHPFFNFNKLEPEEAWSRRSNPVKISEEQSYLPHQVVEAWATNVAGIIN
jgi:hypothetical protein